MFDINNLKFGRFLRQQRQFRDLNQKQFAELLGISCQGVSKLERGGIPKKGITLQRLIDKITKVLDVSPGDLRRQIEGKGIDELFSGICVLLPMFQKILPNSIISPMTPEDVRLLLLFQESLEDKGIEMTAELAIALLASHNRPTTK